MQMRIEAAWSPVSVDKAPPYNRDNPFIRSGYRPPLSVLGAAASVFKWHNETMNVWTHLAGLALFAYYAASTLQDRDMHTRWPLVVFEASTMVCLAASSAYHMLCCVSEGHCRCCKRLDFAGIVLVMWSMYWPWVFYAFQGHQVIRIVYITAASVISCGTLAVTQSGHFDDALAFMRPVVFGLQAVVGVVPLVHASSMYWQHARVRFAAYMVVTQLLLHAAGAIVYVTKVPERFYPEAFDNLANSHTIFHAFIVAGFVAFHHGMVRLATV